MSDKNDVKVGKEIKVLIVEDHELERKVTLKALEATKIHHKVYFACDGEEAINFLFEGLENFDNKKESHSRILIVLDINLPKLNGFEVLEKIKSEETFDDIPVVIFTGSESEEDLIKSYDFGAMNFMKKPITTEKFIKTIGSIYFHMTDRPDDRPAL